VLRRIVLLVAASACVIVAAGTVAWRHHVESIALLLDAQAATARAFLASPAGLRDPARVLSVVARPEIDVLLHDRATGMAYTWLDGRIAEPPPFGSAPGVPPPPAGRPGRSPLGALAAELAHIPPRHVEAGDLALDLLPSAAALKYWLAVDAALCAAILAGVVALAATIGGALARAARRPLVRTTAALEALAAGDFTPQTIEAGDSTDIARLARAYNAAAETVARSIEERRAAAAEFQRFLADAGHELRTPLTIVGGYVDILDRHAGGGDATVRRAVAGMGAATARMRALVEKMLLLSRLESGVAAPRVVEVGPVSDEVVEAMRPEFPDRVITVRCDANARITIDEDDLYEAQRNLVENALRYAPESPVAVSAIARDGEVVIEVADAGGGIPEPEQAMVFERFYRGKERPRSGDASEGSGLGLAIVRRVVERWGGTIALHSNASGTRFVMRFPRAQPAGADA
jgi:signal transduction histidine kinase